MATPMMVMQRKVITRERRIHLNTPPELQLPSQSARTAYDSRCARRREHAATTPV